jgi:hypothetical protein
MVPASFHHRRLFILDCSPIALRRPVDDNIPIPST